jgi:amino acid permease
MIGSGILNQPEVFMKAGVIGALLGYAIGTYSIWLGLMLLAHSSDKKNIKDYVELAKSVYGENFGKFVIFNIALNNFGALMSYITVVGGKF